MASVQKPHPLTTTNHKRKKQQKDNQRKMGFGKGKPYGQYYQEMNVEQAWPYDEFERNDDRTEDEGSSLAAPFDNGLFQRNSKADILIQKNKQLVGMKW